MYTEQLQEVLAYADKYARDNKFREKDTRHYLVALVNVESDAKHYLEEFGITKDNLSYPSDGMGYGTLTVKKEVGEMLNVMATICNNFRDADVDCVHMLLAILSLQNCYAYGTIAYRLKQRKLEPLNLLRYILDKSPNKQNFYDAYSENGYRKEESAEAADTSAYSATPYAKQTAYADNGSVEEYKVDIPYGTDMTERAREGKYDPLIGREKEIERIIQIFSRRNKNNPVLVGEAGVGKSAVAEGLAQAIVDGNVPLALADKRLVELDVAGMVAGTRYRGDFEERLKNALDAVKKAGNVILFINEIHNIVGAGGGTEGSMDAAEIIKPVLARGKLQVMGATTLDEYHKYIEKDPALERRFQPVLIEQPTVEQAIAILRGVRGKYEQHHGVIIDDSALDSAVKLSVRYVNDRFLPDKAFDLLDEACSRVKVNVNAVPDGLSQLVKQLQSLKVRRQQALKSGDLNLLGQLNTQYEQMYRTYEVQLMQYNRQQQSYKVHVTSEHIAQVVAQWTGIPVTQISRTERDKLLHLEEILSKRVVGQQQAVQAVSRAIRRARAGLKDPNRPIGSFIFVGPTGVGKTELTKAVAECMFGDANQVIRLDMSEYMEKQSVSKLIGAPPGYVGFEESGILCEKVRRHPYSVVLFDEIEKAHPDVFNLMLQILDEGRLTDSHGKVVDFRNTVIILTSNVGASSGSGGAVRPEELEQSVNTALRRRFRPEFLNRIDEIVLFRHLNAEEAKQITKLLCLSLVNRLKGKIELRFTESAIEYLAMEGYDMEYGARPLKRLIQRRVEDVLAEKLLNGEIQEGQIITVQHDRGKLVFYME